MTVTETPRLQLRRFELSDVLPLSQLLANLEVMRFSVAGLKTIEPPPQPVDICRGEHKINGCALYAVIHKGANRLIGYCGLMSQSVSDAPKIELGYRLHPAYWGCGLGTEAAWAVAEYAANALRLTRLAAVIEAGNIGSMQVALWAGMHKEFETEWRGLSMDIYAMALPSGS